MPILFFSHDDALVVTMRIGNCHVSKILVDAESSVNILYGGALDMMEDTPEMARAMNNLQTQSCLYGFDGNVTRSPNTFSLLVRSGPIQCHHKVLRDRCGVLSRRYLRGLGST